MGHSTKWLWFTAMTCLLLWPLSADGTEAATQRHAISWSLVELGPGARTVDVAFSYGPACARAPEGTATESAGSVRLTVTVETTVGPDVPCATSAVEVVNFSVALKSPLAGRPILGARGFDSGTVRLPRLVGLAPSNARLVAVADGLFEHVRTVRAHVPRPVVRRQRPAPEARFRTDRRLWLEVAVPESR